MKHTPATPLHVLATIAGQHLSPKDAAYVTHAANAYPRLVEALALIERSGTFKGGTSIEELQSIARAALRELGEDA